MTTRVKPDRKFRKIAEPQEPNEQGEYDSKAEQLVGEEVAEIVGDIDVVTSEAQTPSHEGKHFPVIDVDVPIYVVPTNGPHKYSLYIDVAVEPEAYFDMLDAMARAGIVEEGYAKVSRKRGYTAVRPPWVNKPVKQQPIPPAPF